MRSCLITIHIIIICLTWKYNSKHRGAGRDCSRAEYPQWCDSIEGADVQDLILSQDLISNSIVYTSIYNDLGKDSNEYQEDYLW